MHSPSPQDDRHNI